MDVPFEFDLLTGLLTSVAKRDFEKESRESGVYVCVCAYVCICAYVCVYVCVCVCVCVHV